MSGDTTDGLVRELKRSLSAGAFERLFITWFGGEPTTVPDVIEHLSEHFLHICEQLNVSYESRVITNGLALSRPLARRLVESCKVGMFIVSLDGPERIHDSRRLTKTGKGTYSRIVRNLVEIARAPELSSCALRVRVNIDEGNAPFVHEFIEELADLELAGRVEIDLAVVVPWSLHSEPQIIDRFNFAEMEVGWLAHLMSRGFRPDLLPSPKASACLAAEPASGVVAPDGLLHNCAMTPLALHEITRTTRPLGPVGENDRWQGVERHDEIFRRLSSPDVPCRECKYLFLCQGSCPKDLDKGMLNCPSYKFNLSARMALHYLKECQPENSSEPKFDFSFSNLDSSEKAVVRRLILKQIERFRARFALFRVPCLIAVYAAGSADELETVKLHDGQVRWNHQTHAGFEEDGRAPKRIADELSEFYLAQINPALYSLYQQGEDTEIQALARGFIDWASAFLDGEGRSKPRDATQGFGPAISGLARHACVEQFFAQPVDHILQTMREMLFDDAGDETVFLGTKASRSLPVVSIVN